MRLTNTANINYIHDTNIFNLPKGSKKTDMSLVEAFHLACLQLSNFNSNFDQNSVIVNEILPKSETYLTKLMFDNNLRKQGDYKN